MMTDSRRSSTILPALLLVCVAAACGSASGTSERDAVDETRVVFVDDFDGGFETMAGVTATWSGAVSLVDVQGYRRVGFSKRMLHNDSRGDPAEATVLTLRGLPEHDAVSIDLHLAIIESWDGSCGPLRTKAGGAPDSDHCPDYFEVSVDGEPVFDETFFFLSATAQSHVETSETLLSRFVELGFGPERDLAYRFGEDGPLWRIPHRGDSITISFRARGAGWQGGRDESWGIDNVRVLIHCRCNGDEGGSEQ